MNFSDYFLFFTVSLNFVGASFYIFDTLKGKTKPNRVTWIIWTIAPFIVLFSQISTGFTKAAIPVFIAGFIPLLVLIASFLNKNSYWKIGVLDYICGILAFFALIFFVVFKDQNISIFFGILADALALLPTLIKSYKYPETETGITYFFGFLIYLSGLLVIEKWVFAEYSFNIYGIIASFLLTVFIYFPRKKSNK